MARRFPAGSRIRSAKSAGPACAPSGYPAVFRTITSTLATVTVFSALSLLFLNGTAFAGNETGDSGLPQLLNPLERRLDEPDTILPRNGVSQIRSAFSDSAISDSRNDSPTGKSTTVKSKPSAQSSPPAASTEDRDTIILTSGTVENSHAAVAALWDTPPSETPDTGIPWEPPPVISGVSGMNGTMSAPAANPPVGPGNTGMSVNPYFSTVPGQNASPHAYAVPGGMMMAVPVDPTQGMPGGPSQGLPAQGIDPATQAALAALYGNPYANPYGNSSGVPYAAGAPFNPANPYDIAAFGNPYYSQYNGMGPGTGSPYAPGMPGMVGLPGQQPDNSMNILQRQQQLIIQQQAFIDAVKRERAAREQRELEEEEEKGWSLDDLLPLKISSPLAETMWTGAGYMSPFSDADQPDKGIGRPLRLRAWTDHPYYFGAFFGYVDPSELASGYYTRDDETTHVRIRQDGSGMGGLTLGWNFHHYWGLEGRLHFMSLSLRYDLDDPDVVIDRSAGSHQMTTCDVSVHYYPLGNARWRPYFKYGLGLTATSFTHYSGTDYNETTMSMPVGIGLKYWWHDRLALNIDLVDNIVFSTGGSKTQDNWAFTCGITWSYGRNKKHRPTAYWPYAPSGRR